MTINELNILTFDVSHKVRAFRTFAMLFNTAVTAIHSIDDRAEKLPEIDDISAVAFMLAEEAENAVNKLLNNFPVSSKGLTP